MQSNSGDPTKLPPSHWPAMARCWAQIVPPLRPTVPDLIGYRRFAEQWSHLHGPPRVLLLGVTPELYHLPWPPERDLLAVDNTRAMLDLIWPGLPQETFQANWTELPFPSASRDLVLCDGGMQLLAHPHDQRRLVERLHEIISPGGRCLIRLFSPAEPKEPVSTVLDDLMSGQIANLSILKIRLGTAMQESPAAGVELATIWRTLRNAGGDWETLARRIGWSIDQLSVIDTYRDSAVRYHFLTARDAERLFCADGKFLLIGTHLPDYPFGKRCPVLAFERI